MKLEEVEDMNQINGSSDEEIYEEFNYESPDGEESEDYENYENSEEEEAVYEHQLNQQQAVKKKRKRSKIGEPKPILMWKIWEEYHDSWIDNNFNEDFHDLDNRNGVVSEVAEAPSDLIMPLLRYQKEWLAWALRQEESKARGGILADEMGMGKTIQAIALVLAKAESSSTICEPASSTGSPAIKGTLVICPLIAVSQWVSEIERFTKQGSTKVLVYHGAKREKNSKSMLSKYDFVISTYSTVAADYRKFMIPPKHVCLYCGKAFLENSMPRHLKYFCGPHAVRTEKQSKQQRKQKKKQHPEPMSKKGTKKGACKLHKQKESILHAVKWNRIILDEAHYIKSRRSTPAKAVFALESSYKWALSGTPLQNNVGELYSLVRFLQLVPYSYSFCKDCDCRVLDHCFTKTRVRCSNCPHSSFRHFCWWNKYVAKSMRSSHGNELLGKRAMFFLKHKILDNILLRRTKKGRAADLALPPKIVSLRWDTLDINEKSFYESLHDDSRTSFNTYVNAGTVMNNYAQIFLLLTRLRQAVDHPYLVVHSATGALKNGSKFNNDNSEAAICGICHEAAEEDAVVTNCDHVFCKTCLIDFSASLGQFSCPSCSKLLTIDFASTSTTLGAGNGTSKTTLKGFRSSSILNRIQLDIFKTSTKIEALREEIRFMVERDGSAKGIVFSQFTSFLDLINYSLQKSGINCIQLDGSMTLSARDAAIKKFTEDPDCRIFLMSLQAGGVALNLTVASHVFVMDPWWNPAVEQQAQDRIHRIGQYKPIRIVRFVIEDTVEEKILRLQEKKELLVKGTIDGSTEKLGGLSEADLHFLFAT